jgi:hypothetical protein
MPKIHCYFVVERVIANLNQANWDRLNSLFTKMGTIGSLFPAHNLHKRVSIDGNKVIYESMFDTGEISLVAFRQLLANEFGVSVDNIDAIMTLDHYSEAGEADTVTWDILYNSESRIVIRRFGGGVAPWEQSRLEAIGYLIQNQAEWESIV